MNHSQQTTITFNKAQIPPHLRPLDPRFGPGPSLIPESYVQKLLATGSDYLGTSHRKETVRNVVKEIQEGFKKYFSLPPGYSVIMGNGGATLVFDMVALGLVQKKITHFTCGEFSEKWFQSSKAVTWIKSELRSKEYGEGNNGEDVADSDVIAVTLNETSTGVQMSSLPHVHFEALLCVDATSGGGQCPCDLSQTDVYFFSPQKIFASEGGLWVAILSPKARERALKIAEDKTRYIPEMLSWKQAILNGDQNQTYNTPSLSTLFFLNEQVKAMNQLGYKKVQEMAVEKSQMVYNWAQNKPYLSCYVKDAKHRSVSVATINVDEKYDVASMISLFEKEKVAYGIDAYRKLGKNQFRIALFHNITSSDLKKLTDLISYLIENTSP